MRAVELRSYGDPALGLTLVDLPEPAAPNAGEVLIGMAYAPVNLNDIAVFQGQFLFHPELPSLVGNEGVGHVLAVGAEVLNVAVGDVVTLPLYGLSWRERLVVPASKIFVLPRDGDLHQLAMVRINPVTAALLVTDFADLGSGDWIIQNAGNSAVARSIVAFAKSRGVKTINLVRRTELLHDVLESGADAAFIDDESAVDKIKSLVGAAGVRLALDGVGGEALERLAAALGQGGIVVSYAIAGNEISAGISGVDLIFRDITYRGFYMDRDRYTPLLSGIVAEAVELIAAEKLNVPIAAIYGLDEVHAAVKHAQTGGKVLLKFGD